MRRRLAFALSCALAAAACADILGIDNGIPLGVDASSFDASGSDVASDGSDAAVDDAPVEAPFSPLSCGTSTCNFAIGEACCRTGATTFDCVDAAASCNGTYIPCDRPEQCVGGDAGPRECCTTDVLTDAGTYVASSVACMTKAQCTPIPKHYVLCDDDSSAECPDATSCAESVATLPPFMICK